MMNTQKITKSVIHLITCFIIPKRKRKQIRWFLKEVYLYHSYSFFEGLNILRSGKLYINNELLFQKVLEKDKITKKIDLIVPVYNGFEYLNDLFMTIYKNTDLDYDLYVVDDCSPDKKVFPFLKKQQALFGKKMQLFRNTENQGFLKTVNFAFSASKNDVVIINTDVRLPENWASRLMQPIFKNGKVASVTPFSNAATIFSFPVLWKDNDIEQDYNKTDKSLSVINVEALPLADFPTGVGFCMAMSRKALDKVGLFDEIFGKGYGEENDWCMRAKKLGYVHTVAPNLFVYHKHGGSFISEEKQKLCGEHLNIIKKRYPAYEALVLSSVKRSEYQQIRFLASILYFNGLARKTYLYFDHSWQGGTETYFFNQLHQQKKENLVIRLQYFGKEQIYQMTIFYKYCEFAIRDTDLSNLIYLIGRLTISEIIVNNLVGYPDSIAVLHIIKNLKTDKMKVSGRAHDFYAICPSFNLINKDKKYCNCPPLSICKECLHGNGTDIKMWRTEWGSFLNDTLDEFIAFSESTAQIFCRVYPLLKNKIRIVPHYIAPLRRVCIKKHKGINIGVLGNIGLNKGQEIVSRIEQLIKSQDNVKLVVIGKYNKTSNDTKVIGRYDRCNLPDIMEDNNIDIIFIPSIWPETFSYTTSEAMMMKLPVACFNLGAPEERVKKYPHGLIIEKIDAMYALEKITDFVRNAKVPKSHYKGDDND